MDEFWDNLLGTWWGKILMSLLLLFIAWGIFSYFTKLEAGEAEGRLVPWYVAAAYYIGGKWTVSGIFGVLGLLLGIGGIHQLRTGEE